MSLRIIHRFLGAGFWLAFLVLVNAGAAAAPKSRMALVIGEADYAGGALPNCANDAGLVAQALAETGFSVTAYADLPAEAVRHAFADFLAQAKAAGPDAEAIVYLAGTGVQFDGKNYLLPAGAKLTQDSDVPAAGVDLHAFAESLAAVPLDQRLIFLDLARAHAFLRDEPVLASGLALDAPPPGTAVVFNTAPGAVVPPGDSEYGAFAAALASLWRESSEAPGMLSLLRLRVAALTNGGAVPFVMDAGSRNSAASPPGASPLTSFSPPGAFWEAVSRDTLDGYAAFLSAFPNDVLTPRIGLILALRREASMWQQTVQAGQPSAFWTYMRRYPRGPHFAGARRMLAALAAPLDPPPRFELMRYDGVPPPGPSELEIINRRFVFLDDGNWPALPPPPAQVISPDVVSLYDRFPPLLPFGRHDLPLPFPVQAQQTFETGRIVEPGDGNAPPILVGQQAGEKGKLTLIQEDATHKVMSRASLTGSPETAGTLSQTGPSGAVIWSATVATSHASRTYVQWGPDREVLSMKVVETGNDGRVTVRYCGPDGQPFSVIHLSGNGMILPPLPAAPARVTPAPFVSRLSVIETKPPQPRPPAPKTSNAMRKVREPVPVSPSIPASPAKPDTAENGPK